ncbi:MAG: PRC-barrel domain-containing protein [Alphaproteobacteria bacterium]|nr:PRC-barrel domain-containing protein [Alphaproteobacteria bacterium]
MALAAAPAFAQQAPSDQKARMPAPQAGERQALAMSTRIPVEAASSIVGRMVRDNTGAPAGEVEYILISTVTGQAENVVVGSAGLLDFGEEELTVVPWRQVADVPAGGDIRLNVSKSQINQAPRINRDTLVDLTTPALITSIVDYYGAPQGQTQSPQQGQRRQSAQQSPQQSPQQGQQQAQAPQEGARVLIGREVITTLVPPTLARPSQMRGAVVVSQNGQEVGEIDHVMIDTAHGQVAYVLLARGGFLGMGEEWVPIPLAAMKWNLDQDTYRVTASAEAIEAAPALNRDDLPHSVRATQLSSLYQRYGLTPYWRAGGEAMPEQAEIPKNQQEQRR